MKVIIYDNGFEGSSRGMEKLDHLMAALNTAVPKSLNLTFKDI